jgi:hypothetical protein
MKLTDLLAFFVAGDSPLPSNARFLSLMLWWRLANPSEGHWTLYRCSNPSTVGGSQWNSCAWKNLTLLHAPYDVFSSVALDAIQGWLVSFPSSGYSKRRAQLFRRPFPLTTRTASSSTCQTAQRSRPHSHWRVNERNNPCLRRMGHSYKGHGCPL